ncbi:SDR family NAD(P)-dependent oxidoreductase [Bradyrhizobium sp. LLZ17]|uniref:SDR family NAD(P)-dependent oxidoreductase n=1 Tax=Bradyrhizobium sp. LLZ17 TaxID=3239388 RepID=A0AB39XG12_9BRAD
MRWTSDFFHDRDDDCRNRVRPFVASAGKNKGLPGRSTYSGTKAALRSFARTWTSEFKDRRIRTNVLSPGAVDTPMFDGQFPSKEGPAEARKQITAMTPMARLAYPDEIVCPALFLASDLSSYVAGIDLPVDGGLTAV